MLKRRKEQREDALSSLKKGDIGSNARTLAALKNEAGIELDDNEDEDFQKIK